jgi:hypothetical protein
VTGPDFVGTYVVTSRLASAGTRRFTGSLSASAPAGTTTLPAPPNVSDRRVPGTASGPVPCTATVTCPKVRGEAPKAFERCTRARPPPALVCTTLRIE